MILIVDDDADVSRALAFMTDARGFQVQRCGSGREALGLVDADRPPACLIIDQNLPDLQGIDLLALLRGQGVAAPAVLITTAPSAALRRQAAAAGAPIVEKPLLDEALFTEIGRLLAPRAAGEAGSGAGWSRPPRGAGERWTLRVETDPGPSGP